MKKHILIVDDEEHLADALAHNLQFEGFSTTVAYDGEEGLNVARTIHFDLVILDIMMPKLDGLEVCRRLRSTGSRVKSPRSSTISSMPSMAGQTMTNGPGDCWASAAATSAHDEPQTPSRVAAWPARSSATTSAKPSWAATRSTSASSLASAFVSWAACAIVCM